MKQENKFKTVMREYEVGKLHSGAGNIVTSRAQALAIALYVSKKANKRRQRP